MATGFNRREALAALGAGVALSGCAAIPNRIGSAPLNEAQGKALLDSLGDNLLRVQPETATTLGIDTGPRAALRSQLTDRSAAGQARIAALLNSDLARASTVDTSGLSFSDRTSFEVVKSAYRLALEGFSLPYGDVAVGGWRNTPYVVIQNVGGYLDFPRFLDSDHPVRNAADAEAYLARLASIPAQLDGELGRVKDAAAKGLIAPAFLIDKAVSQLKASLDSARKGGGLVDSLVRRTREQGIAGSWEARAQAIVRGPIAVALARQHDELRAQRSRATMDPGISARPHGEAWYRWGLKASTTTNLTPDDVHQLGLDNLRELHSRMDPLLRSLGYTKGTIGARMTALAKDPAYLFSDGDKGRAEIMAFIEKRIALIRAQMPRAFRTLVKGNLEVKRLPPDEEPGAPAAYGGAGSIDGRIPGKFWINLHTTDLHSKFSLPDLAHHEAIPGHVWQGEYSNQLPTIRAMLAFNAYSEGWALYAEQLADELGVFDDFPAGRLGYLQSIAFRACRLVVDTGLHAKGWSRERGVAFFVEQNGSNPVEVASEVDRYCSWPGQACGYKVGMNEIVRLRGVAQAALGTRYDLRDFNDAVVKGGNVPMDVLAKNIEAYVAG